MHEDAFDTARIMGALYGDGITALKGAFAESWGDELRADIEGLFREGLEQPGGAVGRGPQRYYVEVHPERLSGFADLVTHPWVLAVCGSVLGPDYKIVEIGFDVPLPGAVFQPWHRDFPAPDATLAGRRLNSLAFNLTTVDVTADMGPFEVAVGTQWDAQDDFEHGMFPPKAPDARNAERHDLQFTKASYAGLPDAVRQHLTCRLVDELQPIVQAHTIEGLVMGAAR